MSLRSSLRLSVPLLSIVLLAAGCSSDDTSSERGPLGPADSIGSCVGACGGQSSSDCHCDDQCAAFGDCCSDKEEVCGSDATFCGGRGGTACAAGEYCHLEPEAACGAADQGGVCIDVPDACAQFLSPVCGCDGQTYDNECLAHVAGTSVSSTGACDQGGGECGGFGGLTCGAGEFCDYTLDEICGAADALGTCTFVPDVCAQVLAPVCGCDGQTYDNECEANAAGTSVSSTGACDQGGGDCGGFGGLTCGAGEFCDYTLDEICGAADALGTCTFVPEACNLDFNPVCGCDGQTYSNECLANHEGVAVASLGPCG